MLKERDCQAALKSTKAEVVLNDGAGGRGTGRLKLVIRNGRGTWFGSWFIDGKERKKKLGNYPDMPLKDARLKCVQGVQAVLVEGKNPKAMADKIEKPTVEKVFEGYAQSLKDAGKTSAEEIRGKLLTGKFNAADDLGRDRLACDIGAGDISTYLAKAYRRGSRVTADRTRSYMSAAFGWAIKSTHDYTVENRQDWGILVNPLTMVKKDAAANQSRERNLSAGEIKQLWNALDGSNRFRREMRCLIKLILCCGQRVFETVRMNGSEIDFDQKLWNMPAHKTKGKKAPHSVPLPDLAIPVLRELVAVHGDGNLFPEFELKNGVPNTQAINYAISVWCDMNDFDHFQPRDLRRTWKSRTADAGLDRFTRDLIQQHAKTDTGSRFYDRADYLPQMREAMNRWNDWLQKAV